MEEISSLYNSKTVCPVCDSKMEYTKVRSKAVKLQKQDTDFCPWYEGINPIFYEAVICPECGYGSHVTTFEKINKYEKAKVQEKISNRWIKRSFTGSRTIDRALEAFKIVLLNLSAKEAEKSEIAKIALRIGWLYRYSGDKEQENNYLEYALKNYKIAYHGEELTGKFDEYTCMYIVGELSKRLEHYEDSMQWFSRLISCNSDAKQKQSISPILIENTRDLIQELKVLRTKS